MSLFEKIRDSLTKGAIQPILLPDAMVFPALDGDVISKKLEIEKHAEEDGRKNWPGEDSTSFSTTEMEIQSAVIDQVRPNLQNYETQQLAYQNRLAALDPFGLSTTFKSEVDLKANQLQVKLQQEKGNLYLVTQQLVSMEDEWGNFKKKWNIDYEPKLGMSLGKKIAIILLLIAIEAMLNGVLIGDYMAGGALEAFGVALVFPIVTLIGCAAPTGILLRKYLRPGSKRNPLLLVACLGLVSAGLMFSLLLTYVRQAVEVGEEWTEGFVYWLKIFHGSIPEIGLASFLVFMLSSIFYVIALIDVFYMDHLVPGLLDKLRDRTNKHREYSQRLKAAHDTLLDLQKDSVSETSAIINMLQSWKIEHNNIQGHQVRLWQKMQHYIKHVEAVTNKLIKKYRQINLAYRDQGEPSYFKIDWQYPEIDVTTPIHSAVDAAYTERLVKAQQEIQAAQASLNVVFTEIPVIIRGIDELLVRVGSK